MDTSGVGWTTHEVRRLRFSRALTRASERCQIDPATSGRWSHHRVCASSGAGKAQGRERSRRSDDRQSVRGGSGPRIRHRSERDSNTYYQEGTTDDRGSEWLVPFGAQPRPPSLDSYPSYRGCGKRPRSFRWQDARSECRRDDADQADRPRQERAE